MKKLLLTAVAIFGLMPGFTSTASAELVAEDRTNWVITGCSQRPASAGTNDDGDLSRIKDGNVNTYWHSYWSGHDAQNHFFVVDRGDLAATELAAVGYTPRQGVTQGNGFVTECDVYILDSVEGLSTWSGEAGGWQQDSHSSLETFIQNVTPDGQGVFPYTHNDASNRSESLVTFNTHKAGRYILFVATKTSGDQGDKFANCAEFNAYIEVEAEQLTDVTFNFPEFDGKTLSITVPDVLMNSDASAIIPSVGFFAASGLAEGDNVVTADNCTFTVNGTWEFPFSLNTNYRIKNHGAKNAAFTYFYYNAESNRIQTKNLTDADKMSNERVFYLKSDGGFNEAGNLKVTLHSVAAGDNLGFTTATGSNNDGSFTETPTEFLVVTNSSHNGVGVSFRHPESATAHVNAYSGTSELGIWNDANAQNDSGSSLLFYSVEEDQANLVANGNSFATLGIATEDTANAWTEKIASYGENYEYTFDDYNENLAAYNAMVESAASTAGNAYITLGSFQVPTDLMCVQYNDAMNSVVGRYGDDVNVNKTTWKVVAADGGFKLYNEYSASYLNFPTADNQNSTVVTSADEASVFVLTLHNPLTAQYGVKCIDADVAANREYLHTNNNHTVVRWEAGDNSSWYLAGVDEEEANNDAKEGVKDAQKAAKSLINLLGDKVCQYVPQDETNVLVETLETAMSGEDCNAIYAAARALKENIATLAINKPESGKMYTLRGAVGGFYAVANSDSGQLAMAENVDSNDAAVFTFEAVEGSADTFILTNHRYSNSIFSGTHTLVVPAAATDISEHFTFLSSEGGVLGAFTVKSNSTTASQYLVNRYDYADGPRVDRQTSYGNKCDWVLEEIQDPFNFTEIEEIEVAAPVIEGIYDLQGRKLSAPVKGINIINGKKVLVK